MRTKLKDFGRTAGQVSMDAETGYRTFSAYAEISRKWISVMDTKAGFISALNLGVLAFLWTGAKLSDVQGAVRWLAISATVLSLASIVGAVWVAMPRETLREIFGKKIRWDSMNKPVSFYWYVASEYGAEDFERYRSYVMNLEMTDLAQEALKQHFVICHSVARKSRYVRVSGLFLLGSLICVGTALAFRMLAPPVPASARNAPSGAQSAANSTAPSIEKFARDSCEISGASACIECTSVFATGARNS